jgi:hypothetical protein
MSGPSRWGSFLSQAVAGVEARLDHILADASEDAAGQQKDAKPAPSAPPSKPSPSMSTDISPNLRLQAVVLTDWSSSQLRREAHPPAPMTASRRGSRGLWPLSRPDEHPFQTKGVHGKA